MKENISSIESKTIKGRVILIASLVFALVFAWFAVSRQIGDMFAEMTPPDAANARQVAETAAVLAPRNPLAAWLAAGVEKNTLSAEKNEKALALAEDVVRLSPFDFRWWIELGRTYEQAENYDRAEKAFVRAAALAPTYAYPHWQLGNFYLRRNRADEAFAELKKAVADNIVYREQVFSIAWDYYDQDIQKVEQLAGDSPDARTTLVRFYVNKNRAEDAVRVWNTLSEDEKARNEVYLRLIAQVIYEKRFFRSAIEFARQVGTDPDARIETVSNGGFEKNIGAPKDTYFGWKITSAEKVDIKTDSTQKKEGARSLRVVFTGYSGADLDGNIWQLAAMEPQTKYRVSFWLKTENLRSAGTPTIEIVNANDDKIIVSSKPFPVGSSDWQQITLDFATPENSEGILIRTSRAYCGEVCPIVGTFWLDDFRISKQ